MPRRPWLLAATSLLVLAPALAQPPKHPEPPRFSAVVAESFDAWDADHNSTLSPDEIDKLVVDPSIRGQQAAALAAMKLVVRSNKIKPPALTRDFIASHSDEPAGSPIEEQPTPDAGSKPARPPASLQKRYESALRRINGAKRELFIDPTPDIDHCHQGPLGDCFVVAGIGAMVHRDADSVKKMIHENPDGSFAVDFAPDRHITIPALTDAEYALTSTTGGEGYWLSVLEKAYGALRNSSRPESKRTEETTDAISSGGSLGSTLQALTGHTIESIRLRSRAAKSDSEAAAVAANLRTRLIAAMKDKRLAGAGTGKDSTPPAINGHHAYAILGFDESTDKVQLWNPHGNTFKPKGDPGMDHGYLTQAGRFEMPLLDFVKTFNSAVIETDKPAPKPRGRTS